MTRQYIVPGRVRPVYFHDADTRQFILPNTTYVNSSTASIKTATVAQAFTGFNQAAVGKLSALGQISQTFSGFSEAETGGPVPPPLRITQTYTENIISITQTLRVTQTYVENIRPHDPVAMRITQVFAENIRPSDPPNLRATQVYIENIRSLKDPNHETAGVRHMTVN